ncbi:hypothetical protein diail_1600 [Diaporthe ilicicola]|nr:hypothetical protein diail_1600 [Diaporthe ilicicola]
MGAVIEIGEPQCQALSISDSERCLAQATAYNELFCAFHANQCFGLYMGYKRRNAELDRLSAGGPPFLVKNSDTPPANLSFKNLKDPNELHEIQAHLFKQYVLLGKVIAARQLHHKHFFSLEMDYGHKVYLEKLRARHVGTLRALERIEQRTAAVLYERQQWFKWVKATQAEEEATREKEQKKVKLEAAMFQRHWKDLQSRLKSLRSKEDKLRQDAYLDQVWKERMASASEGEGEVEMWDPIDDMLAEEREKYLDLIRQFLWSEPQETKDNSAHQDEQLPQSQEVEDTAPQTQIPAVPVTIEDDVDQVGDKLSNLKVKGSKSKSKGKKKKAKKPSADPTPPSKSSGPLATTKPSGNQVEIGKGHIESQEEVRMRLREGVERDHSGLYGPQLVGTIQNPVETHGRTAPLPEEDIDKLLSDIAEIKALLLCRTLLSHATLLPAALRAKSVEEFIDDPSISHTDLRDLCLKVEQPKLQELRDACADFARGSNPEPPPPEEELEVLSTEEQLRRNLMYRDLNGTGLLSFLMSGLSNKIMAAESNISKGDSEKKSRGERMQITICGKTIWNHASEAAMARDGWLQFSIIAKDCTFEEAVQLCRNWDEFYELQTLVLWHFFPSAKWASWSQNALTGQLLNLGFIPFHTQFGADTKSRYHQVGSKGRLRRQHHVEECRNLICAHMKRGDPVTNRFIDYCMMQTGHLQILVRDGKTGQILYAPQGENSRWIHRVKSGLGRASKNEFEILQSVDRKFLLKIEQQRSWRFSFDSHYELYIWDFVPGESPMELYHYLVDMLRRARRMRGTRDMYAHQKPVLKQLTQDEETKRVRQIRPGEQALSVYDFVTGDDSRCAIQTSRGGEITAMAHGEMPEDVVSPYIFYNEADAAEDEVLFAGGRDEGLFKPITSPAGIMSSSMMTQTMLRYGAGLLDGAGMDDTEEDEFDDSVGRTKALLSASDDSDAQQFMYSVPRIWRDAFFEINRNLGKHGLEKEDLLDRVDFFAQKLEMSGHELQGLSELEVMERDRSYAFKESFHMADLEPGAREKYVESMKMIIGVQNYPAKTSGMDWAWFCLDIIDKLELLVWFDDYGQDPHSPWPHRYIAQDITQAFVTMAFFFPNLEVTGLVRKYLDSEQGSQFKNSEIFDPIARSQKTLDRRSRTMYRAGIIGPSDTQPHPTVCPGYAFAAEEPHRPGKLDFFVRFQRPPNEPIRPPPGRVPVEEWPDLLARARAFAQRQASRPGAAARFSLLRLWSAPHFYPLMVGYWTRGHVVFTDSCARSWEFKFVPKDLEGSEMSAMHITSSRIKAVVEMARDHGGAELGRRLVCRGDAVLVMAESEEELLRLSTMATFVLQTKPWLREVDLWRSFVNVDLAFLQDLDPAWLD